ncbi:PilZ domain-containing protein [bacterium]|nr:PilZ domain-containing protein [bacterium]
MPQTVSRDPALQISAKGMTFISDTFLPEWTEVDVELQLPGAARRAPPIGCHGVIVQCTPRLEGYGFEVALVFLDLPAAARDQLRAAPPASNPPIVSIAR